MNDIDPYYLYYNQVKLGGAAENKDIYLVSFLRWTEDSDYPRTAVLKILSLDRNKTKNLEEARNLKLFSNLHDAFVKIYTIYQIDNNLYMFMEHCKHGSLSDWINDLIEKRERIKYKALLEHIYTLIEAIYTLHSNRIAHRDIKSDNIFVQSGHELRIGDFGDSLEIDTTRRSLHGSGYSMPPEVLKPAFLGGRRGLKIDYFKVDVWSLGKLFFEICTLTPIDDFTLFIKQDNEEGLFKYIRQKLEERFNPLREMLFNMLRFDHSERWDIYKSIEEIEKLKRECEELFSASDDLEESENLYEVSIGNIEDKSCQNEAEKRLESSDRFKEEYANGDLSKNNKEDSDHKFSKKRESNQFEFLDFSRDDHDYNSLPKKYIEFSDDEFLKEKEEKKFELLEFLEDKDNIEKLPENNIIYSDEEISIEKEKSSSSTEEWFIPVSPGLPPEELILSAQPRTDPQ